jgi:hypothetical protein
VDKSFFVIDYNCALNRYLSEESFRIISANDIRAEFEKYGLKRTSILSYTCAFGKFLKWANLTFEKFQKLPLEEIENLTEDYIMSFRNKMAPKALNVAYCSVKAMCHKLRIIKSTRMFRQIKFDKVSRSTRDPMLFDKAFIRKMADMADLSDKLVIVSYGIYALRPSLIPQLTVGDILESDITFLPDGKVKLNEKTWIWVRANLEGNKARIDFPVIFCSEASRWLEEFLNMRIQKGEKINVQTPLMPVKSYGNLRKIIRKYFSALQFKGRQYLLRHFGSKLLKLATADEDFKEWMCGHKGKISAVYDHEHGLASWEIENYKRMVNDKELTIYATETETIESLRKQVEELRRKLDQVA